MPENRRVYTVQAPADLPQGRHRLLAEVNNWRFPPAAVQANTKVEVVADLGSMVHLRIETFRDNRWKTSVPAVSFLASEAAPPAVPGSLTVTSVGPSRAQVPVPEVKKATPAAKPKAEPKPKAAKDDETSLSSANC